MIGHGDGGHSERFGLFEQPVQADGTVQETVLRMYMQMNEIHKIRVLNSRTVDFVLKALRIVNPSDNWALLL